MLYVPDNYDKWKRHDSEQEDALLMLPKCAECDDPIHTEYCYEINSEYICEDCLIENHRKCVEDVC